MIDEAQFLRWADELNERRRFVRTAREHRDDLIQRAQQEYEREYESVFSEIEFLESQIKEYAQNHLPDGKRTIKAENVTVQFRSQPPKIFSDDGELLAKSKSLILFVKRNAPDCLKVEESVNLKDFKGKLAVDGENVYFVETGEVIDGLHAQSQPDACTIHTMEKS